MKFDLTNVERNLFRYPFLDFFAPDFFRNENEIRSTPNFSMPTDIHQLKDSYVMEIELPGFKKEDIQIVFKDGYLTIKAVRKETPYEEENNKKSMVRRERFYGSTSRTFYVGEIDEKEIKAAFKDGVLTLTFPNQEKKKEEEHLITIE